MLAFRSPNFPQGASSSAAPHARISLKDPRGFTLIELLLVITLLGILTAFSIPMFVSFIQASQTRGAAQELVTLLNHARQLAITKNRPIQLNTSPAAPSGASPATQVRFLWTTAVTGDVLCTDGSRCWTGAGTDGNGWATLANLARITSAPATPIAFNYLGAATASGTLRVQNSQGTSCLDVIVSASGRIRSAAAATCP